MRSFKPFSLLSSLGLLSVAALASVQAQAYNCSNVAAYKQGTYTNGAVVQNARNAYSCTVGGWCSVGGPYEPGVGWAWANAWSSLGACDGATTGVARAGNHVGSSAWLTCAVRAGEAVPPFPCQCCLAARVIGL